jgi:RNA polymerase sigma factor (sigma-70 family)
MEQRMLSHAEPPRRAGVSSERFDRLFRLLYPSAVALGYRILGDRGEAEEILQEAFLRLADSPILDRPDDEVGAWLRRAAINLAFNRSRDLRRARAKVERAWREESTGIAASEDAAGAVLRREAREEVRALLESLPERQRDCLVLRYSGYSYLEIAETLGIAVGSVGVLLARGERAFAELYKEQSRGLS